MNKKLDLIPIINLSDADRLWLQEAHDILFKENKRPESRIIWSRLYGKIPADFSTTFLDNRLIDSGGESITLLGIIALEKSYSIIEKANKMLFRVKEYLINNPDKTSVSITNVAQECNIDVIEAGLIFNLCMYYGRFYQTASVTPSGRALTSIDIGQDSIYFQQYIYFNGLEQLIIKYLEQHEKNEMMSISQKEDDNYYSSYKESSLSISPIFRSRIESVNAGLCFVLMPFKENWSDRVYKMLIKQNAEALGLQCMRADNLNGPIIIEDIWTQINQAGIIIADVTGKNPNVMYELGIVHTLGKPAILITQDINNIPFDFAHLRHYEYADNAESFTSFGNKITEVIREMHKANYLNYKGLK